MPDYKKEIYTEYKDLFDIAIELDESVRELLDKFNERDLKLFDLPAYQRIFLFIITRSVKTYASILELCQRGYGQDVSTLLRSLLENLITARFILHDRKASDDLTARFVAYKWVIFKRQLPEQEKKMRYASISDQEKNEFLEKKGNILAKVDKFKETYSIKSDKALVSWSGVTLKDMAKKVDHKLLNNYESTFRLCSRFSHPSILGDNEYLIQNNQSLAFSPLPSTIGVVPNLKKAIEFTLEFLYMINDLFNFNYKNKLKDIERRSLDVFAQEKYQDSVLTHKSTQKTATNIRESRISFKVR